MYLTELFTTATDWQYEFNNPARIRASFRIDKLVYKVYMDKNPSSTGNVELGGPEETFPNMWDITFSVSPVNSRGGGYDEEDNITGSGNAIAVFSTVIDIIQTTIKSHKIKNLYFTAEEPSRAKLYNRMAKQFAQKGWRYIDNRELDARSDGVSMTDTQSFLLTKQHPHSQLKGTRS